MTHYLIDTTDLDNLVKIEEYDFNGETPPVLADIKKRVWVEVHHDPDPNHNSETHYTEQTITITLEKVTTGHTLTEHPFEEIKITIKDRIGSIATGTRLTITKTDDPCKLSGWVEKARRAERVKAGGNISADTKILDIECKGRGKGETAIELADKQLLKSNKLNTVTAIIDGLEAGALAALTSITTNANLFKMINKYEADLSKELDKILKPATPDTRTKSDKKKPSATTKS